MTKRVYLNVEEINSKYNLWWQWTEFTKIQLNNMQCAERDNSDVADSLRRVGSDTET